MNTLIIGHMVAAWLFHPALHESSGPPSRAQNGTTIERYSQDVQPHESPPSALETSAVSHASITALAATSDTLSPPHQTNSNRAPNSDRQTHSRDAQIKKAEEIREASVNACHRTFHRDVTTIRQVTKMVKSSCSSHGSVAAIQEAVNKAHALYMHMGGSQAIAAEIFTFNAEGSQFCPIGASRILSTLSIQNGTHRIDCMDKANSAYIEAEKKIYRQQ